MNNELFEQNDDIFNKYIKSITNMLSAIQIEKVQYFYNNSGSRVYNGEDVIEELFSVARQMKLEKLKKIKTLGEGAIPVYSAKGGESIFHHNYGKGFNEIQAKISALMEYIERRSSNCHSKSIMNHSFYKLNNLSQYEVVRPSTLITNYIESIADTAVINWLPVINITKLNLALIPSMAVLFPYNYDSEVTLFKNNTNGLAAGSTFYEAIIQAIYEVIERHCISIAFTKSNFIELNLDTISNNDTNKIIKDLNNDGVIVRIKYVPNEFNLPCFIATGDDVAKKNPMLLNGGYGCHSNKTIALIRALTELAQSRASILDGERADIPNFKIDGSEIHDYLDKRQRGGNLYLDEKNKISFDKINETICSQINFEYNYLVNLLQKNNLCIYVSNLTNYKIQSAPPVVRVIIPGLENWYDTRERIGKKVYEALQK